MPAAPLRGVGRLLLAAALFSAGCTMPLQVATGASVSRGLRPLVEANGRSELPVAVDRARHEALWIGGGGAFALTSASARYFFGPELLGSRLRNPRSADRTLDAVWVRPEYGASVASADSEFVGGSVGAIHEIRRIPFTVSVRAGTVHGGSDAGFYSTVTIGVVLSSSLYWMQ